MGRPQSHGEGEERRGHGLRSIGDLAKNLSRDLENPEIFSSNNLVEPETASRPVQTINELVEAHADARQLARVQTDFYAELNLCRYPFASLWDKDTGRTDVKAQIVVQLRLWGEGEEFCWKVTPDSRFGLPGPFDRKVFRAIEKILYERTLAKGLPLANPQPMSPREILQVLRLTVGGKQVFHVTRALQRLTATTIDCYGVASIRGSARTRNARAAKGLIWHPISHIAWAGEHDPKQGKRFNVTTIWLSDFYTASFNNGNVRPIDWDLWLALKRPIAQRLYEILETRFFGMQASPYVTFQYRDLCELLPAKPQQYRSNAMRIFDRAHEELKGVTVARPNGKNERISLLDRTEWAWDGDDATIRYFPNDRYLAQLKQRRRTLEMENPGLDHQAWELARDLDDMKSINFYRMIVCRVDVEIVRIARTEALMAKREGRVRTRVAAYFVSALTAEHKKRGLPPPY